MVSLSEAEGLDAPEEVLRVREPSVEQRVNRLEREVRWWRLLGCVGILGAVTLVVMGQAGPARVIEADKFVLRDSQGNVRAWLGEVPESGAVSLVLADKDGKIRTAMLAPQSGGVPDLLFYDAQGEVLCSVLVQLVSSILQAPTASATPDVIESRIDDDFEGWDGDTVFILENGQIWQQVDYAYHYHYAYRPKVLIYRTSGGGYKMRVDGKEVKVRRIK